MVIIRSDVRSQMVGGHLGEDQPPSSFSLSITFFAISAMLTLRFWLSVCPLPSPSRRNNLS